MVHGGGHGRPPLASRFPKAQFPGVITKNRVPFLKPPTGDTPWTLCYQGHLMLPNGPGETAHWLGFFVSFVVPYYALYSIRDLDDAEQKGELVSFAPSPEEQPFVSAILEELAATYPEHDLMPGQVGMTVVPELHKYGHGPDNKATIFDCLFTDTW